MSNYNLPAVTDEDMEKYEFGPAMLALTERRQKFVISMIESGGLSHTASAIAAGLAKIEDRDYAKVVGYKVAYDPKVQDAIREMGLKMLSAGSIMAVKNLLTIADDSATEKKDRLKAIEMILNRTGMHATTEHKVAVTHRNETNEEMIKKIELLAGRLGVDAQKLLGNITVEAEFEEITEDDLGDIF